MEIGGDRLGVQAEVMEKEKEVTHGESHGRVGIEEAEELGGPRMLLLEFRFGDGIQ